MVTHLEALVAHETTQAVESVNSRILQLNGDLLQTASRTNDLAARLSKAEVALSAQDLSAELQALRAESSERATRLESLIAHETNHSGRQAAQLSDDLALLRTLFQSLQESHRSLASVFSSLTIPMQEIRQSSRVEQESLNARLCALDSSIVELSQERTAQAKIHSGLSGSN